MNDVSVIFFLINVTLTFLFYMTLTLKEILIVTLNWMIFFLFYITLTFFLLCVTLTLKEILTVTLNLMMHDVYVYAPLIYYVLFYLSVCAFYEKSQECELDDLQVDLDDDLEVDFVCMIFYVTIFESDFLEWRWTDLDLEADLEELRDFFLDDFFTIFESDFLERHRTDLDLEADPEELGDLFTFYLEDLDLAPFDGSAACDLDSVSDLKISAASPVPFFFSVRGVVCFALGLLDCFCLLPDNGHHVSFVECFISFLSP